MRAIAEQKSGAPYSLTSDSLSLTHKMALTTFSGGRITLWASGGHSVCILT